LPPSSPSRSPAATRASRRSKRWDRLRAGLDLILDQWGAGMTDVPGGASESLVRGCKGKEAASAADPHRPRRGLAGQRAARPRERQGAEELGQWKTRVEE
jgi:hypothetical protein